MGGGWRMAGGGCWVVAGGGGWGVVGGGWRVGGDGGRGGVGGSLRFDLQRWGVLPNSHPFGQTEKVGRGFKN